MELHGKGSDIYMAIKPFLILGLVCTVFGIGITFIATKGLDDRPEKEMVRSFLLSNSTVVDRFGSPITVTYTQQGASVSYGAYGIAGRYRFRIDGSNMSGVVEIQWANHPEHGFWVDSIELLNPPEKPEHLWP